uniref:Conserved oligomeric Golgi complex subunit 8 n=1 Tax=Arcella intermedia TaxID=1963864 RepID=A0A6B2L2J8_9EUKA|eukprot:TRINITY_DN21681_c0_g1_i1.p1 TRINITY_DN21681_c0_g1~~TRINITY_DN21681_c0_g1_i1.p1  ORF type:complete len:530 (-),score=96.89 TRINITY_DN21681_c0_g1_i1:24-1418(-)
MENFAFSNYKTLIKGAECTKTIHTEVKELAKELNQMEKNLSSLSQACFNFTESTTEIAKKRKTNYITLQQHNVLLELLELPQLMDTCVKGKFYEEALELEQYAASLYQNYPSSSIVMDIMKDVAVSTSIMISQLHIQLSSQCKLSDAIRIVNFLKRLGIYSETELRIAFLQCRGSYMNYVLSLIPTTNNFINISKMIDTNRSELLEIISQYNTIFSYSMEEGEGEEGNILYSWTHHKIQDFLNRLKMCLENIKDGSFLTNVLNSCMFFGKNLGRVGMDFRALLPPIFENCILIIFDRSISRAITQFGHHIRKYRNLAAHKGLSEYNPATDPSDTMPAPRILLDFPPVAILTNAILETFNELRTCWPYSLKIKLTERITENLHKCIEKLREHKNQTAMTAQELEPFEEMCQVFAEVLLPYISQCIEAIFHSSTLLHISDLQNKMSDLYQIKPNPRKLTQSQSIKI